MSNSDIKTIFADLVVEMESLLGPELDRFISQRSVYKSAVSTRNNLEHERLTGEITVQDETDYEAASQAVEEATQAVEEAKASLISLEAACTSKAEQTGWYDKIETHVSLGQATWMCIVATRSLPIE